MLRLKYFIKNSECDLCKRCVNVCTYQAMAENEKMITILPEKCNSCGKCYIVCPKEAVEKRYV